MSAVMVLAALSWPGTVSAQQEIGNDSFDSMQQGRIASATIIEGEMYAVSFAIPPNLLPAEMLGVRVVMVDGPTAGANYCGRFTIEVWEDDLSAPVVPSSCNVSSILTLNTRDVVPDIDTPIYSMSAQFASNDVGFELRADPNNYQDLLFSSINNNPQLMATIPPVILTKPEIRVGLKALDRQCGAASGDEFPLMLTDLDGERHPGRNFLYGYLAALCPPNFEFLLWSDMAQFFSKPPGDFVMRLLLRTQGGMDMDMGMMMPDMNMEEDMFVVVDMMPDGSMVDMQMFEDMQQAQDMMNQPPQDMSAPPVDQNPAMAELSVTSISPSSVKQGTGGSVILLGEGFEQGAEVRLNAQQLGVLNTRSGQIEAALPSDLDVGVYDVIVSNPDGDSALLSMGFEVTEDAMEQPAQDMSVAAMDMEMNTIPEGGEGVPDEGCGCQSASQPAQRHGSLALLALGLIGIVWRRKRS